MSATIQRLDDCLSIRDGELYVEEVPAQEIAERFGTPLHVVSEDQLRRNARRFKDEFAGRWPGEFLLLPSIKANSSLALRRILTDEGTGCDVFGPGELEAALRTGTDPSAISLNGPMKGDALLERAINAGVAITLDSRAELDRTAAAAARLDKRARIRLRFRPDLVGFDQPSEMSPEGLSIREAVQRYKAGIPTEDILGITEAEIRDPAPRPQRDPPPPRPPLGRPGDLERRDRLAGGAAGAARRAVGRLGSARARPRRRLPGAARPVRPAAAAARRRPGPVARGRCLCPRDLPAADRAARRARHRTGGRPARARARPRALRRCRDSPGDGWERQAPDRADAARLDRDRTPPTPTCPTSTSSSTAGRRSRSATPRPMRP